MEIRPFLRFPNTRCSDSPFGNIDDSLYRQIILRIIQYFQITEQILDLLSGIEIDSADNLIGNIRHQEFFLKQPGLGIGAVQNREITIAAVFRPDFFRNFPRNILGFLKTGQKLTVIHQRPVSVFRPQLFLFPPLIVGDHFIRRRQNISGRTVILFQFDHFRIRKNLFKAQNILNVRAAEFVNRLIVIADHTKISVLLRQQTDKAELHGIRILVLVHHEITQTFLIRFQYLRTLRKQLHRVDQQIVKIHSIVGAELFLIFVVDIRNLSQFPVNPGILPVLLRGNHLIFCR